MTGTSIPIPRVVWCVIVIYPGGNQDPATVIVSVPLSYDLMMPDCSRNQSHIAPHQAVIVLPAP